MYWLRIHTAGDESEYIEFHSAGNPMPRFSFARRNSLKANGLLDFADYNVRLLLKYPTDLAGCWDRFAELEAKMDQAVVDLRLYDVTPGGTPSAGNLIREWLSTDNRYQESPRIVSMDPVDRRGFWVNGIIFTMVIQIIEGSPDNRNLRNQKRRVTVERENGKETWTLDINAEGTGSRDALDAFKAEYKPIAGEDFNYEREIDEIDDIRMSGTYTLKRASGAGGGSPGVAKISETVAVEGGGRDVSYSKVTGDNDPVEFVGPRRDVKATITGRVVADKQENLLIPNRDSLPGHVRDDTYHMESSEEAKASGNPAEFAARYTQIFKLANKEELSQIVKIKSLRELQAGATTKKLLTWPGDSGGRSKAGAKGDDRSGNKNKADAGL